MLFRHISRASFNLIFAALSQFAFFVVSAQCEQPNPEDTEIKISVRAIQASEPHKNENSEASLEGRKIKVVGEIKDLETRLSQLPFNNFQLLSSKEETLAIKHRDSLQLPNGHTLIFRPIYADDHKAGLWLNWRDRDGSEILNTRIHFDADESVLTGTECAEDKGLILAIKAAAAR